MSPSERDPRPPAAGASEPEPRAGPVATEVTAELPGLCLRWLRVAGGPGPVPAGLRARLRILSDRRRGIDAVALRTRPLPRAYRAFMRQVGLDPDVERIPAERAEIDRLRYGGLVAQDRIAAACLIAIVETGAGVSALDAAAVAPDGPGVRLARAGEAPGFAAGALVVADDATVHAPLLGEPLPASAPGPATRELVLYAFGVPGVPEIHLHEALWQAADALEAG